MTTATMEPTATTRYCSHCRKPHPVSHFTGEAKTCDESREKARLRRALGTEGAAAVEDQAPKEAVYTTTENWPWELCQPCDRHAHDKLNKHLCLKGHDATKMWDDERTCPDWTGLNREELT